MKQCEKCNKNHDGKFASGRFCSKKCAIGFSTQAKRKEINKKLSEKLTIQPRQYNCELCNKQFFSKKLNRKFCSVKCSSPGNSNPKKMSLIVKQTYINGRQPAGGKTKWFQYKNIKVQGSYELRICKILDTWKIQHLIYNWDYTHDQFQYLDENGDRRTYFPDFKIWYDEKDFYYVECKGFLTKRDFYKHQIVKEKGYVIQWWTLEDIQFYEKIGV